MRPAFRQDRSGAEVNRMKNDHRLAAAPGRYSVVLAHRSSARTSQQPCLLGGVRGPGGYSTTSAAIPTSTLHSTVDRIPFFELRIGGGNQPDPLASPASGYYLTIDPSLHVPVPSDQSLGPILTSACGNLGRHKFYVAVTYQYFLLRMLMDMVEVVPTLYGLSSTGSQTAGRHRACP